MTLRPRTKDPDWRMGAHRSGTSGADRFAALVTDWWKAVTGGVIGLVVLGAAVLGYVAWSGWKEHDAATLLRKAVNELDTAKQVGQGSARSIAEGIQLLHEVTSRFPATAAAGEATLRLGAHYYTAGKYEEARTVYVTYLSTNPRGGIAFAAGTGVGDTYLAQRNYEKAIETYSQLIERFPQEPLLPETQLHLLKAYFGGNRLKDALTLCEKIIATHPNTGWSQRAQVELNRLSVSSVQ